MIRSLLSLCLLTASCGSTSQQQPTDQELGAAPARAQASAIDGSLAQPLDSSSAGVSLEGWRTESIELPPAFAPRLPKGREALLFAPGMFRADAPDFWSYAFVIEVEAQAMGQAQLQDFLELYYVGLITSVARGKGLSLDGNPAQVQLEPLGPAHFRAEIILIDAFVTALQLTLHLDLRLEQLAGRVMLRVMASPQDWEHAIWKLLPAALHSIQL